MRKNATKIAALALSLALTVTSVNVPTNASAATKKAKLNKTKATLYVGGPSSKKSTTLKVTVNGKKKKATFTSSKKAVATVNKKTGKVTAKKAGKTVITAKVGKKSYKCTVTVKKFVKVTSVSVSPKSVSLNVGDTKTVKATVKPSKATTKKVSYTSSNKSVATVTSAGKITAKAAGKATITVKATDGSNKKATVAVTVKDTATEAPTTAPSAEPSAEPSTEPTAEPSAEPTAAPATLGNITELTATSASKLVATFDAEVPADATIEVTKGNSKIDGKATIADKTVTFDATAKLTAGTYTLTATLGETKVSKEVEVKDEYVAKIVIKNKEALTTNGNKTAYIYYDVENQYGDSIRSSTTIEWTVSSGTGKVDKTLGRIAVTKSDAFTYGSSIYVTGVHVKSGTSVTETLTIGMPQAVNSIEFAGFLNVNDKTKKLDALPADFAKDSYVLLYKTFDQNGNELEVTGKEIADQNLTFICDNVLLLKNDFKDNGVYTVDGVEYSSVMLQPGQYVDKGGDVSITAIANKTGQKTVRNFTVGGKGVLQSLVLSAPAKTVADGDGDVKIPYVAKDTAGNTVTNYETIARSTNKLTLNASEHSELVVKEENDGTAGIYWTDSASPLDWSTSSAKDNMPRNISLSTIVIGGESNNLLLEVSDTRRPDAIKKVILNSDDNNAIVSGGKANVKFSGTAWNSPSGFVFVDQYGEELGSTAKSGWSSIAGAFFQQTDGSASAKYFDNNKYGIKVDVEGNPTYAQNATDGAADTNVNLLGLSDKVYTGSEAVAVIANSAKKDETSVKYSIVKVNKDKANAVVPTKGSSDFDNWEDVSKVYTATYTVAPIGKDVTNYTIGTIAKQRVNTAYDELPNADGKDLTASGSAISADLTIDDTACDNSFVVKGSIDEKSVTLPVTSYVATGSAFNITSKAHNWWNAEGISDAGVYDYSVLTAVDKDMVAWTDLYDVNTAKQLRKDANKILKLAIVDANGNVIQTISKSVTISDAPAVADKIRLSKNYYTGPAYTLSVDETTMEGIRYKDGDDNQLCLVVTNQYGKDYVTDETKEPVEVTVSDIKEADNEYTHVKGNFSVTSNGTTDRETVSGNVWSKLKITGAEIGDSYKLTAKVAGTDISTTVTVTVGADSAAKLSSTSANSTDEGFRQEKLGYDR